MKPNEMFHFSHPNHKVKFDYTKTPFKCDGCKEAGLGSRYRCNICDHDLHVHCALPSPLIFHPFYPKCAFRFLSIPPGNIPRRCNACEKIITHFVYNCKSCGFDLHPCCANLPTVLNHVDIKLYLYPKVNGPCHRCGLKGRSWSYRSKCKAYNLHVGCVKDMLLESWRELYVGKGKKLEGKNIELKNTTKSYHSNNDDMSNTSSKKKKSKIKKCCQIAGGGVQIVISAVLGDPTLLIAGLIGSLMTRV